MILIATDISEMKKKENELIELDHKLEQELVKIKELRIELINEKLEAEAVIGKLDDTNKKLAKEITKTTATQYSACAVCPPSTAK